MAAGARMQIEFISSRQLQQQRWQCEGVLVVLPFTRAAAARRAAQLMAGRAETPGLILCIFDEGLPPSPPGQAAGFVALANMAFRQSESPWFCYAAQDAFAGRRWLALAVSALERRNGALLAFNDGKWQGQLAAFGLVRRHWAEQLYNGDLFFPGYRSHYADVELTVLALQQQGLVYEPNSLLVEVDWQKDSSSVNAGDRALYRARAKTGFDGRISDPGLLSRFK